MIGRRGSVTLPSSITTKFRRLEVKERTWSSQAEGRKLADLNRVEPKRGMRSIPPTTNMESAAAALAKEARVEVSPESSGQGVAIPIEATPAASISIMDKPEVIAAPPRGAAPSPR